MIEACWPWMKKRTTVRGAPRDKKTGVARWLHAWDELEQTKIQSWIERIPFHIQEIIRLGGGNEYIEGRRLKRDYKGQRLKGQLSRREDLGDSGWVDAENEWIDI